jgi:hypothetical protein
MAYLNTPLRPLQDEITALRRMYPKGTRVRLLHMDDMQAPPVGTKGTVIYVDDIGTIHVRWDTGSSLGLIAGEDEFEVV